MHTFSSPPPPSIIDRADRGLAASLDYDMLVRDIDLLSRCLSAAEMQCFEELCVGSHRLEG
jgi:hypothetical protein